MKLQEASEEVTMELRDSSKLPTDTTTGIANMPVAQVVAFGMLDTLGMHIDAFVLWTVCHVPNKGVRYTWVLLVVSRHVLQIRGWHCVLEVP